MSPATGIYPITSIFAIVISIFITAGLEDMSPQSELDIEQKELSPKSAVEQVTLENSIEVHQEVEEEVTPVSELERVSMDVELSPKSAMEQLPLENAVQVPPEYDEPLQLEDDLVMTQPKRKKRCVNVFDMTHFSLCVICYSKTIKGDCSL